MVFKWLLNVDEFVGFKWFEISETYAKFGSEKYIYEIWKKKFFTIKIFIFSHFGRMPLICLICQVKYKNSSSSDLLVLDSTDRAKLKPLCQGSKNWVHDIFEKNFKLTNYFFA
jgi:hypothetical protein